MGLLKHGILPFYVIVNFVLCYKCLIAEDAGEDLLPQWGGRSPGTLFEQHMLHFVGGVAAALLVNSVVAIFMENSHYRGMAVLLQTICFVVDGYSYYKLGVPLDPRLYVVVGSGIVGLVVHSMEPGIFTKDKVQKSKSP